MALVNAANSQEDPMQNLKAFTKFDRNGLNVRISCKRVAELDDDVVEWAFQLTKSNMQLLYAMSEWGWNDKEKHTEMTDPHAWYLIAHNVDRDDQPVAAVHFRFDIDSDDEVLYCYEIQLCEEVRRKGLGKFLMQILELMAFKAQMKKVMVTVLRHNAAAHEFFLNKLKYEVDETSPEDTLEDALFCPDGSAACYQILSKSIAERRSQNGSAGTHEAAASTCCEHCQH